MKDDGEHLARYDDHSDDPSEDGNGHDDELGYDAGDAKQ